MLLTLQVHKRNTKKHRPRTIPCDTCSSPIPPSLLRDHDGKQLCRVCHTKATGVRHRVCNRCHVDKPLDSTHYYHKTRGIGFMLMCRLCRDTRLRARGQRICGGCWKVGGMESYTLDQWGKSFQELALCFRCDAAGRGKHAPKMDERICPRCNVSKHRSAYYSRENSTSPYCKVCTTEYNKERYRRIKTCQNPNDIDRTPRTIKYLYAMQSRFGEQELVDAWASGSVPKINDAKPLPTEARSKGDTVEFKHFMKGFETALRGGHRAAANQETQGQEPAKRGVTIHIKRRNHTSDK